MVRLPDSLAFPDDVERVEIISLGRARRLVPEGEGWDAWFDEAPASEDFMAQRDQPAEQTR